MILLDTHVWIWWMHGDARLSETHRKMIEARGHPGLSLGVSVISCWEVAMLAQRGRIALTVPVRDWVAAALTHPAVTLVGLTPDIAVASTQLPEPLHRDPADRFLIATAITHKCPILTIDREILSYGHVQSI